MKKVSSLIFLLAVMVIAILVSAQPAQAQMQVQYTWLVTYGKEVPNLTISATIIATKSSYRLDESSWGHLDKALEGNVLGESISRTNKMPKGRKNLGYLAVVNIDGVAPKDIIEVRMLRGNNVEGPKLKFELNMGYAEWFAPGSFRVGSNYLRAWVKFNYKGHLYICSVPVISWKGETSTEFSEFFFVMEAAPNAVEDENYCEKYLEGFENPHNRGESLSSISAKAQRQAFADAELCRATAEENWAAINAAKSSREIDEGMIASLAYLPLGTTKQLEAHAIWAKLKHRESVLDAVARATEMVQITDDMIASLEGCDKNTAIEKRNLLAKQELEAEGRRLEAEKLEFERTAKIAQAKRDRTEQARIEAERQARCERERLEREAREQAAAERLVRENEAREREAERRASEATAKRVENEIKTHEGRYLITPIYWDRNASNGTVVLLETRPNGLTFNHHVTNLGNGWRLVTTSGARNGEFQYNEVTTEYVRMNVALYIGSTVEVWSGGRRLTSVLIEKGCYIEISKKGGGCR